MLYITLNVENVVFEIPMLSESNLLRRSLSNITITLDLYYESKCWNDTDSGKQIFLMLRVLHSIFSGP